MIDQTLRHIETRIRTANHVPEETRQELLTLVSTLKQEVSTLAKTEAEQAESIAGYTQVSTHEAMRREPDPALVQHSVSGLAAAVRRFEISHPRLTQTVGEFCRLLSDIGI